ncbi:uncharacterized protein LOC135937259 isoform X3 [Cloeon dipterum]|uniref:uncharacterized protein LOC135937259 isoform X3 n=1 Tax=Cloeon dipterum TaxID=197152 RepID=UPI00321FE1A6
MKHHEVEFTWQQAQSLNPSSNGHGILVAHLLEKIKRLHEYGNLNLPSNASRPTVRCQYCFNFWNEQLYKVRIKAKHRHSTASLKVLRRYNENPNQLRPIEKNLVKKLQKTTNNMVLTCSVCHKTTSFELPRAAPKVPVVQEPESVKKKKKKKKKDKLCGLSMSISGTGSDLLCRTPLSSAASSPLTMSPCPSPTPVKTPKILIASTPKGKFHPASTPNNSKNKSPSVLPLKSKNKKGKPEKKSNKNLLKQKLNRDVKNSLRDFLTSIP